MIIKQQQVQATTAMHFAPELAKWLVAKRVQFTIRYCCDKVEFMVPISQKDELEEAVARMGKEIRVNLPSLSRMSIYIKCCLEREMFKFYRPVFDDGQTEVLGNWIVAADNAETALQRAKDYFNNADANTRPFLCPHRSAWRIIGVRQLEFKNGVALL